MVFLRGAWPYICLAALAALAYGAALNGGYVWDDKYFFVEYAWMDDFTSAWNTAFSPLFQSRSYVRPLPLLAFYLEILAFGRSPAASHAINIALHVLCASLVFLLARRALKDSGRGEKGDIYAFMLATIFLLHPALSETVIWVSSRFDLMATLFMLLALWVSSLDSMRDWPRAALLALIFFLAAMCKESTASLPIVLALYQVIRHGVVGGRYAFSPAVSVRNLKAYAAMFAAGIGYLLVRQMALGRAQELMQGSFMSSEHVARIFVSLAKYLQLTFVPFLGNAPQHSFYWGVDSSLIDYLPQVACSLIFISFLIVLLLRRNIFGLVFLAWLVGFLPVLHLVPLPIGSNVVHQRFMYFSVAVLVAFAPYAFAKTDISVAAAKTLRFGMAAYVLLSIVMIQSIVPVWSSDLALWQWAVRMDPRSGEARENLIWAQLEVGDYDAADRELERLMEDGIPTTPNVAVNMGVAYYRRGNFDTAKYYLEMAYANQGSMLLSQRSRLATNLAVTYALSGDSEKAESYIEESLELDPHNHIAIGNYLALCSGRGVDVSKFGAAELERAKGVRGWMEKLMKEHNVHGLSCGD